MVQTINAVGIECGMGRGGGPSPLKVFRKSLREAD